jgi:hypothetical protein
MALIESELVTSQPVACSMPAREKHILVRGFHYPTEKIEGKLRNAPIVIYNG